MGKAYKYTLYESAEASQGNIDFSVHVDGWGWSGDKIIRDEEVLKAANGHDFVDIGMKDDDGNTLYWATCNIGAKTPQESGYYFAWGDPEYYHNEGFNGCTWESGIIGYDAQTGSPIYNFVPMKTGKEGGYIWKNYKFCTVDDSKNVTITRYLVTNKDTVLSIEDDIAHYYWGGNWRMPTKEECENMYRYGNYEYKYLRELKTSYFDANYYGNRLNGSYGSYFWTSSLYYGSSYYEPRPDDPAPFKNVSNDNSNGDKWCVKAAVAYGNGDLRALSRSCGLPVRAVLVVPGK